MFMFSNGFVYQLSIYITIYLFLLFVSILSATGNVLASELPDNVGKSPSVLYPASMKASNGIGVWFDFLIRLSLLCYLYWIKILGLNNKNRIDWAVGEYHAKYCI